MEIYVVVLAVKHMGGLTYKCVYLLVHANSTQKLPRITGLLV